MRTFRSVRAGEGCDTWTGFACLFAMLVSHSILETARDALFLASIPATRLPWMYIAIAVVSLAATQLQSRTSFSLAGRTVLSLWNWAAAVITLGFWAFLPAMGEAGVYALYVWSGVLMTLVLVHFWTLMGDLFSVTQAKRLYGVIGAGSVLGAIAGSGAASAIARLVEPRMLVIIAAGGFVLAGLIPFKLSNRGDLGRTSKTDEPAGLGANASLVWRSPYARRVALLLAIAAAGVTLADYLFKQAVAAAVPARELGSYLATVAFVLNGLSLLAQLILVPLIVRRVGVTMALALLPVALVGGASAMVLIPGLSTALLVKGADGSLRYSLHRTASELLFVPLSEKARRRVKAFIDVVGLRGGQALASSAILGLVALGVETRWIAALLVTVALGWLGCALGLQRHYLGVFRRRIGSGPHVHDFPELDVASLENLVAALDSSSDEEVIAALDILEREGKVRLIPGLILYHPSEQVVVAALELFARVEREGLSTWVERLLDHRSPRVRAAAVAAQSILRPDPQMLRMRLSTEESVDVRATIMVNLIAGGELPVSEADDAISALLKSGSVSAKVALADAVARRGLKTMTTALMTLASDLDPAVRRAAIGAIEAAGDTEAVPVLVDLLADERVRAAAQRALQSVGRDGFDALCRGLEDQEAPAAVRWQIPDALTRFEPQDAADFLIARLPREPDGMVRYRSIRALQKLASGMPTLSIDDTTLDRAIAETVSRAYRYLDRGITLEAGVDRDEGRRTAGYELLSKLLVDKRAHCTDRLFRLLSLRYPREDLSSIARALRSPKKDVRASSIELVENLLHSPLRGAVVGLVDDMPDGDRLHLGRSFHEPLGLDYDGLLRHMLDSRSSTVQDLTAYHLGELGVVSSYSERLLEILGARKSADVERVIGMTEAVA